MQFGRCFFVKNAEWVRKKRRNYPPQQVVGKVCIYKNRANSLSLSPNPFLVVKGCVCLVGFASCKALVHTRPASVPGLSVGLPPQTKQGCLQSAAQSHCTMRWHKWLTTCMGATPKARMLWLLAKSFARCKTSRASNAKHPFSKIYRFFDSLSGGTIRRRLYYLSEISDTVMSALQL